MDMRSYLRGMGVGIAVTTVILTISFSVNNHKMTDLEVVSKAKELGLVETSAFLDNKENKTEEQSTESTIASAENITEPVTEAVTQEKETEEITEEATTEAVTEEATTEAVTEASTEEESKNETQEYTGEKIVVELKGIIQAYVASEVLQSYGIIEDAEDFTQYLRDNKLTTKIFNGEYEMYKGMSYEEIAKKICNLK